MRRSHTNVRLILATLILGVALALGFGPADAATSSPLGVTASLHQIGDGDPCGPAIGQVCSQGDCATNLPGCCSMMIEACCGVASMALIDAAGLKDQRAVRSGWLPVQPTSLSGTLLQAARRPPRA